MTLSCVTELLTRHFGRGFYLDGRPDLKFTNVLWPNVANASALEGC